VQELLALLNPASLADEEIHGVVANAAYYAVKYRRQAVLPPLLLLLGPDHADADWFQVGGWSNGLKVHVQANILRSVGLTVSDVLPAAHNSAAGARLPRETLCASWVAG
jgi:hypothetical protein